MTLSAVRVFHFRGPPSVGPPPPLSIGKSSEKPKRPNPIRHETAATIRKKASSGPSRATHGPRRYSPSQSSLPSRACYNSQSAQTCDDIRRRLTRLTRLTWLTIIDTMTITMTPWIPRLTGEAGMNLTTVTASGAGTTRLTLWIWRLLLYRMTLSAVSRIPT